MANTKKSRSRRPSRSKGTSSSKEAPQLIVLAMADALEDILRTERRTAA